MPHALRPRRLAAAALTVAAVLTVPLVLAACGVTDPSKYPDTTFAPHTDFGAYINDLWNLLLRLGTVVFIFVEGLLVYAIFRYREKPGAPQPKHVHGNTTLEILWTVIPAAILVMIAVPTVRTIFLTQAKAEATALQVEVYGHQWWWEFRYPQYGVTTADELYLPIGRKANFALQTRDVLHSFWIPELGGKRDLISNHTNYLWFTPDSTMGPGAWNGSCNEYCGDSHANMRFRTFVVSPANFERWAAHQATPAVYPIPVAPTTAPAAAPTRTSLLPGEPATAGMIRPVSAVKDQGKAGPRPRTPPAPTQVVPAPPALSPAAADTTAIFPRGQIPVYAIPATPTPADLAFTPGLTGDPARGLKIFSSGLCIGCHTIKGNPMAASPIGPNLTHIASRYTIAGSLYPNDTEHLRLWIKNARVMKPGVVMPTVGMGQTDPQTKAKVSAAMGGLTDQQIADIVAYLQELK
jgi:cytochrome c oxidase subunit 2